MSGLSRTPGKRVYGESRTAGSNPALSARSQDVHAPEPGCGRLGEFLRRAVLIQVGLQYQRFRAELRNDFPAQFFEEVYASRGNGYFDAFAGEPQRDGPADTARGAGDEGGFA